MTSVRIPRWDSLRKGSPILFLIAGVVLIIYATLYGLEASMGMAYPDVRDFLLPTGYILGVVGLLGLYPLSVERTPRLARVAAVMAVGSLVGWFALLALSFGDIAGGLIPQPNILPGAFFMAHPLMMILAYSLFALAVIRTDFNSRTFGLFLLAPPIFFIVPESRERRFQRSIVCELLPSAPVPNAPEYRSAASPVRILTSEEPYVQP